MTMLTLPLLTDGVDGEGQTAAMQTIQERIAQAQQEGRHRFPWPLRWLTGLFQTIGLQRTRIGYPACFNKAYRERGGR